MFIQSRSNPKIKHIRQLTQRKYRQKSAQFVIEGATLIQEALQQGWQVESLYLLEGYAFPQKIDAPTYVLSAELMDYVSQMSSAPEALAVFLQTDIVEDTQRASAWILADRLQDPGNFGALLRLADALNWRGIMAFGHTPDPFQMKVIRGSMGASLRLPIVEVTVTDLQAYQQQGWRVVATAADAEHQSVDTPLPRQMILALGHEGQGLHAQLRAIADLALAIPIHARVESLNVVTAGAMLAHEYLRQHGGSQ
jgi:RNA methyltransferase, TrmH family